MSNTKKVYRYNQDFYEIIQITTAQSKCYVIRKNSESDGFDVYWTMKDACYAVEERIRQRKEKEEMVQ